LDENEKETIKTKFLLHFATRTKLPLRVELKEILLRHGIETSDEEIKNLLPCFFGPCLSFSALSPFSPSPLSTSWHK
jgi:hypothetical protein